MSKLKIHQLLQKKMRPEQWLQTVFAFVSILLLIVGLVNYFGNPYKLFATELTPSGLMKNNIEYNVSKYYCLNRAKPEVLLLGTSRVGHFPSESIKPFVKGRFYNLALPESSIREQYMFLEHAIRTNKIHTVIMELSFVGFVTRNPLQTVQKRLKYRFYPPDYTKALFTFKALSQSTKILWNGLLGRSKIKSGLECAQGVEVLSPESYTIEDRKKTMQNQLKWFHEILYLPEKQRDNYYKLINEYLPYLTKIIDRMKARNIQIKFYFGPQHQRQLDMLYHMQLGKYIEYLFRKVISKTEVYSFLTEKQVSRNLNYFIDSHHPVPSLGKKMFARMFHHSKTQKWPNFGLLLTKKNVEEFLRDLRSLRKPFDPDILTDKNYFFHHSP